MQKMRMTNAASAMMVLALAAMVTGCGVGTPASSVPAAVAGPLVKAKVFGGQQPVAGAVIQFYAVGNTGYGSAATALLTPGAVVSDAGGNFNFGAGTANTYTCPSASAQTYLVATGGTAGGYSANSHIALMAALGSCGNLGPSTFINLNEVSTIGSVYALAPFMTGIANVGTSATNSAGMTNAMADVNVLVNTASGTAGGSTAITGATIPTAELNTLANILAACINSNGGAAGDGSACGNLFTATNHGTAPTDTVTAALNIALYPGTNVATLYVLPTSTAPFQPALTTQPNDFTVAVTFAGGSISAPAGLAADASGNIWIANGGSNTVTELAHNGVALSGTGYTASLNSPSAIAIASDSTVWVPNKGNSTVSRLTSSGGVSTGSPYSGGGLSSPVSLSFDSLGTAWIANSGNASVTGINSTGTTLTSYTPAGATGPIAVAVNPH